MSQKIEKAWLLLSEGKSEEAFEVARQLLTQDNSPEVLYLTGCCQKELRQYRYAALNIQSSLNIQPQQPGADVALADCLYFMGHINDAARHYNAAISKDLDLGAAHCGLGRLQPDDLQALKHYRQAVELEPQNPEFITKLATRLVQSEKLQEASELFFKALKINPDYHQATSGLAMMYAREREYKKVVECVSQLQQQGIFDGNAANAYLLSSKSTNKCADALRYAEQCLPTQPQQVKMSMHIQMAHIFDHLNEYDNAWHHLTAAKKYVAQNVKYNAKAHSSWINSIINKFTPGTVMGLPKAKITKTIQPIFIVGMPRSGTSLTEQILCSHPDVHGGGELPHLNEIVGQLHALIPSTKPWPECVDDLTQESIDKISTLYLKKMPAVSAEIKFITDKMPHNFFVVGLIRLMFPEAKIIHCTRNEMDNGLSLYFQDFEEGHDYCADLYDIGTHYHQYQRLMNHWKVLYPDNIMDVVYEDTVADPENTIRALLKFCNLSWHDDCLNFNKGNRTVRTASFDQVHQPLYTKSVERWNNYAHHLDKLKEGLERGI